MHTKQTKILIQKCKMSGIINDKHRFQLDCSPACKPDQSYQVQIEAAMSTNALPNYYNNSNNKLNQSTQYKLLT
jgi:hypothetical protein